MKLTANDFTTEMPDDWEDRTMVTLVAPFAPGEFAANVVVTKHFIQPTESIEDFVRGQTEILRRSLPDFELLDYRAVKHRGFPACQQLHRFSAENGAIQQVQTFVLANGAIYAVTGTAAVTDFDRHINAFRQIVENFRITGAE